MNLFLTGIGADEKYEEAMKEGYVTIYVTKCTFTGPPGSGKSNLRSLILDEKRPTVYHSTPIATEAIQATPDLFPSNQEDMVAAGPDDVKWMIVDDAEMKQLVASGVETPKYEVDMRDDMQAETDSREDISVHQILIETKGQVSHLPTIPVEVDIPTQIQQLLSNPPLQKPVCLNEMRFIYLVDTGGQPQFQEVLPMFVRNASVNVLVFKLSEKLSDCPAFNYYLGGKSYCEPQELQLTNKEIIEHAARSTFSCCQTQLIERVRQKPKQPAVVLVGTFKDQSSSCSETLESKHEILYDCLEPYINEDGIIAPSRQQLIFEIDGSEEGWSRNDDVLTKLRKEVIRRSESMKIDMPIRWFVFHLTLKEHAKKNKFDFVTLEVCYEIGKQCQMNHTDVDQVLLFLDEVNIILYYPKIIPNMVFCNSQFLLRKVTEIIVASFECLDLVGDRLGSSKRFHKEGIFSCELISAPEFQQGYSENFSQNDLLLLLEKLLIVAKVGEGRYFMPCVLPVEPQHSDEWDKLVSESDFPPLVFSFSNGYSPRGLFCALIVYLTSLTSPQIWKIAPLEQKRNLIEFKIQTCTSPPESIGTVVIKDMLSLFVVNAFLESKYCPDIRLNVYTGILHATERLYYDHSQIGCEVGFFCDDSCGILPKHGAAAQKDGKMKCTRNPRRKAKPLTIEQQPWYAAATSSFHTESKLATSGGENLLANELQKIFQKVTYMY